MENWFRVAATCAILIASFLLWRALQRIEGQRMQLSEYLSIETQKKICDHHVQHFKKLIELGNSDKPSARSVRVDECERYTAIWTSGLVALEAGASLPGPVADELGDALWSGEVDDLLTADELTRWNKHMADADDGSET